jgi:hypothetical protein
MREEEVKEVAARDSEAVAAVVEVKKSRKRCKGLES